MKYLTEYDGVSIYIAGESRFDCVGGIIAGKERVIDLPYSPGYTCENAVICKDGVLLMKAGGGSLKAAYPSAAGKWEYTVYYDMSRSRGTQETGMMGISAGDAVMEIKAGNDAPICVELDPAAALAVSGDISLSGGQTVIFSITAPEGARISRIEICRKE